MNYSEAYNTSGPKVADTLVTTGQGILHSITITQNDAAPTAGTIDIYDGISAATPATKIFSWTFTTAVFLPFNVVMDCVYTRGLYIDFTTTADVNVSLNWRADK